MLDIIVKYKNVIFLTIGTILIIISLCLVMYDKVEYLKSNVFDEVEYLKYQEINKDVEESNTGIVNNEEDYDIEETPIVDNVDSNIVEEEKTKQEKASIEKEFIGYLEIKKINLKQGLVSKNSYYNNVNRNIQILSVSDYPDVNNGNFILASHSGSSAISYFKHLYKLELNDEAKVYYKNYVYTYKITNIYNVPKTGSVNVKRDAKKTTMTLITCTHNSKTEQTVYILELVKKESEA